MTARRGPTVVVGLGNPLMGDDGIGVALLDYLRANYDIPEEVLLLDGTTWGDGLVPLLEGAQQLVFLDAIDIGVAAGTPVVLEAEAVGAHFSGKLGAHFADLRDVLGRNELHGPLPGATVAVGLQPGPVALGLELSASACTGLEGAAALVVNRLASWGFACLPLPGVHA